MPPTPSSLPGLVARALRRPDALLIPVVLLTLELLRASGPALDSVAGAFGVPAAAGAAVLVYLGGSVAGIACRWLPPRAAALTLVTLLVALRLTVQVPAARTVVTVGAATAVALAALVATVLWCARDRRVGPRVARAFAWAVGVDVVARAIHLSWDPLWRHDAVGWASAVVVCLVTVVLAVRTRRGPRGDGRIGAGVLTAVATFGPALALCSVFVASGPFVASQSGLGLLPVSVVLAVAVCGAVLLPVGTGWRVVWPCALVVGVAVTFYADGPWTALGALVALAALIPCLTSVFPTVDDGRRRRVGAVAAGSGALVGLGFVFVVLPYQAHYETPMPFDNVLFVVAATVAVAGTAWRAVTAPTAGGAARLASALVAVTAIVVAVAVPRSVIDVADRADDDEITILSWNIHYGVDSSATVDPPAVAAVIARSNADVVLLQEVSRGWPIGGGLDGVTWLADALGMAAVWSPAADGQFGNVILTRLAIDDVATGRLTRGEGSQVRSFAAVTVTGGDGARLRVITAHLQHRDVPDTRLRQIDTVLSEWNGTGATVLAGDLNSEPGWPEITRITDAGFVSAQDTVGDPAELTSPADEPKYRVDWLFTTPDLDVTRFAVLDETTSDHRPLLATVRPGDVGG